MKYLILFSLFAMNLVDQPAPEVKIEQGILSGKISSDGLFFEYLGIPYATTNSSTRFQAPLPAPRWEGVFRATEEIYQCPQNTPIGVLGTEDCLKINVYVPAMAPKPLPVMIYIHGGGFILGSGGKMIYAPDFLLKHDVIIVTFNYRLGPLGFVCLGIKEAPGNAGMKDQVAALRWVKRNIAKFGGDPDNVTIFGHSAGGTSVGLLIASDITDGLFQRAIILSGSSLTHWAMNNNPVSVASKLAKLLGHELNDPKELYDLFLATPYKDLIAASTSIPLTRQLTANVLNLPCVEKTFPGEEKFLSDFPFNLLMRSTKNITLMYGSMDKEGFFLVSDETEETLVEYNERNLFANDLVFKTKEEEKKVAEEVRKYYFGNKDVNEETLVNLSQISTDLYFEMPTMLEAELMVKKYNAPVYYYYFTYSGGRNLVKPRTRFADEPGACHGDDILYIFKGKLWPYKISPEDERIIDFLTTSITNFAKYGDPTPEPLNELKVKWQPNLKELVNFMYIGDEQRMGPMPQPETFKFWKNIYENYRRVK